MPDIRPRSRREAPTQLVDRLELVHDWYEGMISPDTRRLVYKYDPETDETVADGNPIRNIGAIRDVEVLNQFLDREDLGPVVERSLEHYGEYITAQDDFLILDPDGLGEPSGIAHSGFMILALAASDSPARKPTITGLARGILDQQRDDGSYGIYFGGYDDEGLEFYPGEAMLALMETYAITEDPRHLISAERGFNYYRDRFSPDTISNKLRVFYANWQSQYGVRLHEHTDTEMMRDRVRDYIFALHDRIVGSGFYDQLEEFPDRQVTVQVASALEGLNDAYTIAEREGDDERVQSYGDCIRAALQWLLRAQRLDTDTPREQGGFGHSLSDRSQRIDVTGHAVQGFIKSAQNGLEP